MTTARDLVKHLADLLRRERDGMTDFLLALADFDRRKLWRDLGHTSLFYFLRQELGLSSGAAQYRKTAADLIQRFPAVEAALRSGQLCLSSVAELAKVVTPENIADVLPRFYGLSSREASFVAVSIRPVEHQPRREVVTSVAPPPASELPLAAASATGAPQMASAETAALELVTSATMAPAATSLAAVARGDAGSLAITPSVRAPELPMTVEASRQEAYGHRPRPVKAVVVEPLDATWSRLHITVSRDFLAKLEAAKDALSHSRPRATADEVLEACMDLLLAQHARRKAAMVERPRSKPRPSSGRTIPAHVRRAVWKRAAGRCEWTFESGERCGSTRQLEFDHAGVPRARGGPATFENVKLHCRPHNQLGARRVFGDKWMDRYAKRSKTAANGATPVRPAPGSRQGPGG